MEQLDLFGAADKRKVPATFTARSNTRIADLPPAPAPVTIHPVAPQQNKAVSTAAKPRTYRPLGGNPHKQCLQIAAEISTAWHGEHGGESIQIPVGVVAALALWPLKGPDAPLLADWWLGLGDKDLLAAFDECWAYWWIRRPDLIDRASPLHAWIQDERPSRTRARAVRAVVHEAITNGLLHLTSGADPYFNSSTDILGTLVTFMRSTGAKDALAEFHTPPEVSEMMARFLLDDMDPKPGMTFNDPTSGTGGMFRAAAQLLRERELDPADFGWAMTDIDPVAAAGAAANAILWGLGPNVVVACGDTLHQVDPIGEALKEQREAYERRDQLRGQAAVLAAVRKVQTLLADIKQGADVHK
ncbi:SAM-dependent methyltransferase [Streptomyces sp. NBC_00390]|uniref:N-6 DNA methylase n=1 Tax=Streptomyces sp. NBC_00390 TaxID=2975736 RepID=UPI002E1DDB28